MQSQFQTPSKSLPELLQRLFLLPLVGIVAFFTYSVSNQNNPENATLAQLRDAGSIKLIIYDPHHQHRHKPSAECPDRRFIGYIPKIRGIKAVLTVSKIARYESDIVLREQTKPWEWRKKTELRNGRVVTEPIGNRDFTPGAYRARLTVEKNGEKITVSCKHILTISTIPNQGKPTSPILSGFARRTAVRRFFCRKPDRLV